MRDREPSQHTNTEISRAHKVSTSARKLKVLGFSEQLMKSPWKASLTKAVKTDLNKLLICKSSAFRQAHRRMFSATSSRA